MTSVRVLSVVFGIVLLVLFASFDLNAQNQSKIRRESKRALKRRYGKTLNATQQCWWLFKKKYRSKNKKVVIRGKKPESVPLAEYDPNDTPPPPKPNPQAKPEAVAVEEDIQLKSVEEEKKDKKSVTKNDILSEKNIPPPTSKKHEEIRKLVAQRLKDHKDGDPIRLEPLYFTFDESEFAVVDMEPFLVAVEYAMQGRIVLIEGHTDSRGKDDYNVKLSIRRVERIRQLMLQLGVPDEHMSVVGYGEEISTHDNTTEDGRQKNRRVDFTVF